MTKIKELEKLCKDQYQKLLGKKDCATISYSEYYGIKYNKEEISFDHVEQRGDFLVASKTNETVLKMDYYENNQSDRASYALYFIVPYKDGKIGNDTLLLHAYSHSTKDDFGYDDIMGGYDYRQTSLAIRRGDNLLASIDRWGYTNLTDKNKLADFIANAYLHPDRYSSKATHDEEEYSVLQKEYDSLCQSRKSNSNKIERNKLKIEKKFSELKSSDLQTNLDRVSKLFDSFIGSDGDIEKMKEKAYNEANLKRKEERKAKIEAKIDKLKKPFKDMAAAKELKRKQKERAKKEKEITKSLSRAAGRDK